MLGKHAEGLKWAKLDPSYLCSYSVGIYTIILRSWRHLQIFLKETKYPLYPLNSLYSQMIVKWPEHKEELDYPIPNYIMVFYMTVMRQTSTAGACFQSVKWAKNSPIL